MDNKKYSALNSAVKDSICLKPSNSGTVSAKTNLLSAEDFKISIPIEIKRFPGNLNWKSNRADLILSAMFSNREIILSHGKSVSKICEAIANQMKFSAEDIAEIKTAGLLHDIGKIEISDTLLNKIGQLEDNEWAELKQHSNSGYKMIMSFNGLSRIAGFILEHHERWDGFGYPRGLSGEDISLQARIIAVADVFDAMTSVRPYRKTLDREDAMAEIIANAGTQFDPSVVKAFLDVSKQNALYA